MGAELAELYEHYAKELYFYACSLAKNKTDAEILVSDAFFQLALQDPLPQDIKHWLFRDVKNQFIDQTRHKKRWLWQPLDTVKVNHPTTPESLYFQSEKYRQLDQAIDQLDFPYQEVILLFYFLNWSTAEIAVYLHFTPGQVRTILYRARKKLKEAFPNDRVF